MEEIWKDIKGYEGLYQVSNLGNVKSLGRTKVWVKDGTHKHFVLEKIRKQDTSQQGYKRVILSKNGTPKIYLVHRLVAEAFIPNPEGLEFVNHINEQKGCNIVSNLEWCSFNYNIHYSNNGKRAGKKLRGKINTKISKKILQYSLDGTLLREWPSSMEIQRETGLNRANICSNCRGVIKTSQGFIWKYKEERAA